MRWPVVLLAIVAICLVTAAAVVGFSLRSGAGIFGQGSSVASTPVPVPAAATAEAPATPTTTPTNEPTALATASGTSPTSGTLAPTATKAIVSRVPVPPTAATSPTVFPLPPGPAPGDPYTISPDALATRIHELINRERITNKLNSLATDTALTKIALNNSENMAANNYFAHVNPQGQDPTARGEAAGYTCRKDYGSYYTYGIAENIFQNNRYTAIAHYSDGRNVYDWSTPEEIAQSTVGGWMNSSGHRKNILTATFDREGIGVAISNDDKIYITENFC